MAFAARYGKRRSGTIAAALSAFPSMLINLTCRVPWRFFVISYIMRTVL